MHRCLELAQSGAGYVAPNPMVGAVLVYKGRIIGEGYHQQFGKAHAEVNCIKSVSENDKELIAHSCLYVSLEPCAHFGKTPPCTDLIIQHKIPEVIIGSRDPFAEVNARLNDEVGQGKGIEKLKAAGVKVEASILENECREINRRFFTFHEQHRPYIILKWAETSDHKIAGTSEEKLRITNDETNRLVHKWRSEEASILIGTNTALLDNPELTTRYWNGPSPIRLVVDLDLKLPSLLHIFNKKQRTIIFNTLKNEESESLFFYKVSKDSDLIQQLVSALYKLNIQSVLVEGGAKLLQSFIDREIWDEVRIIKNEKPAPPASGLIINNGLAAPNLINASGKKTITILNDTISFFQPV